MLLAARTTFGISDVLLVIAIILFVIAAALAAPTRWTQVIAIGLAVFAAAFLSFWS